MNPQITVNFSQPHWEIKLHEVAQLMLSKLSISQSIDPFLLLLVFTDEDREIKLPPEVMEKLADVNEEFTNNRPLIHLGNSIISVLVTDWLMKGNYPITESAFSETIECLIQKKGLNERYFYGEILPPQSQPEIFKALLGALYWSTQLTQGEEFNSLNYINQWLQLNDCKSHSEKTTEKASPITITGIPSSNQGLLENRLDYIGNILSQKLGLVDTQLQDMDSGLLLLAFTNTTHIHTERILESKYGDTTNIKFVIMGKYVLQLVIASLLINDQYTPGQLTRITDETLTVEELHKLMRNKQLDIGYYYGKKLTPDASARIFEALIGVIHWSLEIANFSSIQYIKDWLTTQWDFTDLVNRIKKNFKLAPLPQSATNFSPSPSFTERIDNISQIVKNKLGLTDTWWEEIDSYWLFLVFTTEEISYTFSQEFRSYLIEEYGVANLERFEFYGDRVMSVIVTYRLLEINFWFLITRNVISLSTTNKVFECMMDNKGLCDGFFHGQMIKGKQCADIFEAIIGLLYWYLEETRDHNFNILGYINKWLNRVWNYDKVIAEAVRGRQPCIKSKLIRENKQTVTSRLFSPEAFTIPSELEYLGDETFTSLPSPDKQIILPELFSSQPLHIPKEVEYFEEDDELFSDSEEEL